MAELLKFPVSPQAAPPDQCEREQALDITQSWIVEAPAGSGKTGLLIHRYLKLLADEEVREPEQVLAITFTEKAAAEIRERVIFQLVQLAADRGVNEPDVQQSPFERGLRADAQAVLGRDAALGWGLLERPDRLNVRTIDSVCAEIARSLPVLSGAGGVLEPTPEAQPLYSE
ncbi:MAG: UvrD-helicase domain-containing protein, partial [Acidobacteriaceae bacterium]|nr:UvrD-helicase domain-containing protein [Acidobacteriaceae bacterium]